MILMRSLMEMSSVISEETIKMALPASARPTIRSWGSAVWRQYPTLGGFVEDENVRFAFQPASDHHLLLIAAAELAYDLVHAGGVAMLSVQSSFGLKERPGRSRIRLPFFRF